MLEAWVPPLAICVTGIIGVILLAREVRWAQRTEGLLADFAVLSRYDDYYHRGDWRGYVHFMQRHAFGSEMIADFTVDGASDRDLERLARDHYTINGSAISTASERLSMRTQPAVLARRLRLLIAGAGLLILSAAANLLSLFT